MKPKYKIIDKKNIYKGFFELNKIEFSHEKHDGTWSGQIEREIFGGAHVSSLLPYDPIKKEIILIQQFRAGVISRYDDSYLYEIVAGIIGKNEKPEETALRECEEETNYSPDDYKLIINIRPYSENYMGENKIRYRHIWGG